MKRCKLFFASSIVLTSAFTVCQSSAICQSSDNSSVVVHYRFEWVMDTTGRTGPYIENMALALGKHSTLYKSSEPHRSPAEYYQYPNEKKMVRKEKIIMFDYLIKNPLPVINWTIRTDTASFGGLRCQKATTHFKGRDYTAWFCPDLPLQAGPWKLNGLPGIILDAYDSKKQVVFRFDRIEKLTAAVTIEAPADGTPATEKEFARLQEAFRKDPDAFLKMIAAQGDGSGRTLKIDMKPGPGPVINNPMEVPEKNAKQ